MREIKFRAWDKWMNIFHHYWGEGSGLSAALWLKMFPDVSKEEAQKNCFGIPEKQEWHEQIIFNQYTGLKDSHGNEVYEGDIIEAVFELLDDELKTVMDAGVVVFKDYGFRVQTFEDHYEPLHEWAQLSEELKVIGNIYEK